MRTCDPGEGGRERFPGSPEDPATCYAGSLPGLGAEHGGHMSLALLGGTSTLADRVGILFAEASIS